MGCRGGLRIKLLSYSKIRLISVVARKLASKSISAVFGGGAALTDTVFTFFKYDYGIGGGAVQSPSSEDGSKLALWGANGTLDLDPQTGLTNGRFQSGTATLGMNLVVRWQPIQEPGSMGVPAVGLLSLFGFSVLRNRRQSRRKSKNELMWRNHTSPDLIPLDRLAPNRAGFQATMARS